MLVCLWWLCCCGLGFGFGVAGGLNVWGGVMVFVCLLLVGDRGCGLLYDLVGLVVCIIIVCLFGFGLSVDV